MHEQFEKYGVWVVAVGRLFAGVRGAMVLVAGTIRFTFSHFIVADGVAAIFSGGLFMGLGYYAGHRFGDLKQIHEAIEQYSLRILLGLAVVGLLVVGVAVLAAAEGAGGRGGRGRRRGVPPGRPAGHGGGRVASAAAGVSVRTTPSGGSGAPCRATRASHPYSSATAA